MICVCLSCFVVSRGDPPLLLQVKLHLLSSVNVVAECELLSLSLSLSLSRSFSLSVLLTFALLGIILFFYKRPSLSSLHSPLLVLVDSLFSFLSYYSLAHTHTHTHTRSDLPTCTHTPSVSLSSSLCLSAGVGPVQTSGAPETRCCR